MPFNHPSLGFMARLNFFHSGKPPCSKRGMMPVIQETVFSPSFRWDGLQARVFKKIDSVRTLTYLQAEGKRKIYLGILRFCKRPSGV